MQRAKKYTLEQVAALLPWPDDLVNKYSRGKLTLIAGCADYPGAACLAAVASQRMGAGYTCLLYTSQSGETADTLAAIRDARVKGARVFGITNVVGSPVARESDGVIYTKANKEIAVASTKMCIRDSP